MKDQLSSSAKATGSASAHLPVIGITGLYCAGKSTVAGKLCEQGWVQIEVDHLGHTSLQNKSAEVIAAFGDSIVGDGGQIDRKKLGNVVFASQEALAMLESIVHPEMVRQTAALIEEFQAKTGQDKPLGILVNAAILFKMGLNQLCDFVIWIHAPLLTRIQRARSRDGLSWKQIYQRFSSQSSLRTQLKDSHADMYKVENVDTGRALAAIEDILKVRVWSRTEPTS